MESLADTGFQTQKKPPLSDFDLHLLVPKAGLEPARISTVVRLSDKLLQSFESTGKTGKDFDISHYSKSCAKALTK
ncbi:hypothetical protein [Enterobacter ludwigii]|uniref:hypothetical protein n=1 Tax=Enterobacter ludwigii TaxID=299767 RepID=UPI00207530E7|nr:hypothetical protein [Enterobacter ludwigii]MCM7366751.1 hypothetical protein [Enterobacter ludwigii]